MTQRRYNYDLEPTHPENMEVNENRLQAELEQAGAFAGDQDFDQDVCGVEPDEQYRMEKEALDAQARDAIAARSITQRFIFQMVHHSSGERTEPFIATWPELYRTCREATEEEPLLMEDYILLVQVLDDENSIIPQTPLIRVETFLKLNEDQENAE